MVEKRKKKLIDSDSETEEENENKINDEEESDDGYNLRNRKKKKNKKIIEDSYFSEEDIEENEEEVIDISDLLNGIMGNNNYSINKPFEDENNNYLDSLPTDEKDKLLKMEEKIKEINISNIPLRYKILDSNLEDNAKALLMQKVIFFEKLEPHQSEYFKMKKFMDGILNIPFKIYKGLKISSLLESKENFPNKILEIREFITNLKNKLNCGTYGQNNAKNSIIEIVAKWISNPKAEGNVIGLCGPPGTGKTSLIKNGLSKALDLPSSFISLGGAMNSSFLEGADYTYEGSKWGRIVDILMENKCMNPILFFDELDKITDDKYGEEIISFLIHLTDFSQNSSFQDKYFSGIEFDLSKCFIIFSFNDKNKLNPILRDRINIVEMDSFNINDKIIIAKNYCIENICKNVGIDKNIIKISDETFKTIIINYCPEKGVRKVEQCLNSLVMKINLFHITRDYTNLGVKGNKIFKEFSIPYIITPEIAIRLLDPIYKKFTDSFLHTMYS